MAENPGSGLRRSTRTVIPTTPFTIDNSPPPTKKKKAPPAPRAPTVPEITVGKPIFVAESQGPVVNVLQTVKEFYKTQRNQTESGVPLTTYSNKSLDTVMADPPKPPEISASLKGVTVKQLLAKNFTNYRVRQSLTSERATELVNRTLSENTVPQGVLFSGPPEIPPSFRMESVYRSRRPVQSLQQSLECLVANAPEPEALGAEPEHSNIQAALESLLSAENSKILEKTAKIEPESPELPELQCLDEFAHQILKISTKSDPTAYPGNHLPFHQFWKHVPHYRQGDIHCYVADVTYTPMSEIIKAGKFMVPLDIPVEFSFNQRLIKIGLEELLTANGINMHSSQHYRMLQGLLQKAGVHVRMDYAERLLELQTAKDHGIRIVQSSLPPIRLTSETLPLMCIYPDVYMRALGKRIHGATIVDTSADRQPLPGQSFLTTVYSEPLPVRFRRRILVLHDLEVPVEVIAAQFGCTIRTIQETIGTRILIDRHVVARHLEEADPMRPRSKIRRTHYVDLNKLVWKHFKDCQASGVQINGKHLKDQAMRYAKEMGLETFRGSEGWLDAFKRRHRIDLKTMTGYPVCYENDMYDEVDKECQDLMDSGNFAPSSSSHHMNHHHHLNPMTSYGSAPDEFAASFFSTLGAFPHQGIPTIQNEIESASASSSSNHLQNMINSMMTTTTCNNEDPHEKGRETIVNVMKSCQIKVADKEVSHALDTLRTYILAHDPPAMSLLVPLQERLALTSAGAISNLSDPSSSSASST